MLKSWTGKMPCFAHRYKRPCLNLALEPILNMMIGLKFLHRIYFDVDLNNTLFCSRLKKHTIKDQLCLYMTKFLLKD